MTTSPSFLTLSFLIILACAQVLFSQSSTGSISGTVSDQNNAVIQGATVTVKNTANGFVRTGLTNSDGRYRFVNIPTGTYEVAVEAPNFSKYVRSGITVDVNQHVVVDVALEAGGVKAVVTVNENASLLNRSTAEVSTHFDERRLSELPIAADRNVLNVLLSVPGVTEPATGQASYASGLSFSANGGRLRSNNFMVDGQDVNDQVFTGEQLALNNPDAIQEVNITTNQFKAEYGRNSSSVVNFVGKAGTNEYHGSLFWFHNSERLNACSNLDQVASGAPTGFCNKNAATEDRKKAPNRRENQIGFTFAGPLTFPRFGDGAAPVFWKGTDKTFIFGDYQRWSDRAIVSGPTIKGAPTTDGRAVLQLFADRPQVKALLDFVPAGTPNGNFATFTGAPRPVELGDLTGSVPFAFDDHQGSVRIDHRLNKDHLMYGRYRFDKQRTTGFGQATPTGLTSINSLNSSAVFLVLNSVLTNKFSNEVRTGATRFTSMADAEYPFSKTIPSIGILGLGVGGTGVSGQRTAIGYPPTLPGGRIASNYQVVDAFSYASGDHSLKFGVEFRRNDVRLNVFLNTRGTLSYASPPQPTGAPIDISNLINDRAQSATVTLQIPGGDTSSFYRWHELYTLLRTSGGYGMTWR